MINLIEQRLSDYDLTTDVLKDQALREIVQEIALYALSKSNFFDHALFHGGTSLRIIHQIPRFSEDLDFMLRKPNPEFPWTNYIIELEHTFAAFGIDCEIQNKGKMDSNIRKAMLKDNSITRQINLSFDDRDPKQKIRVKLEIDVNPPMHSGETESTVRFPYPHKIRHQDLPSNFALKISAMLCRAYTKGRDWYDFVWYVSNKVHPNLRHLQASLVQNGRWKDQDNTEVGATWLNDAITKAVEQIDWDLAKKEIRPFATPAEYKSLDNWNKEFFVQQIEQFLNYFT